MTDYKNQKLIVDSNQTPPGKVSWQSPSNIAIIKYWGKHGVQLPNNPSISFTLHEAYSRTELHYQVKEKQDQEIEIEFKFHGEDKPAFAEKIRDYFGGLTEVFPFLRQLSFHIHSENSFPHSAGIASSASGMSALALCLCSLEDKLFGTLNDDQAFRQKASYLARLGSGSACRSIYPGAVLWGRTIEVEGSSDLFAVPFQAELHENFQNLQDTILLVSKREKSVSSRAGHQLMEGNIYAENRYMQARQRLHKLLGSLRTGNWEEFGQITENEALTLHALMMTSQPSFLLMEPNSLEAIQRVRAFREDRSLPLYFTLDAGPNLHLIYPETVKQEIQAFIASDLAELCEGQNFIHDYTGEGPKEL
jgi:diphosphomevalonate decarboxylase